MSEPFGYLVVRLVHWEAPEIVSAHVTLEEARHAAMSTAPEWNVPRDYEVVELPSLEAVARFEWRKDEVGVWEGRVPAHQAWQMTEVPLGD
jgi:hypothetical protein